LDAFDKLFSSYFSMDQDGVIRKVFDVISSNNTTMKHPLDIIYPFTYASTGSHEDGFYDVAALAAAVLSCQFHGNFVVCQRVY